MPKEKGFIEAAQPFSQLGRQPGDDGTGSDAQFYEWIAGADAEASIGEFYKWFLDDLREEHDPAEVKKLLDDWYARLSKGEFFERLSVVEKLLPPEHVFFRVKGGYS